MKLLRKIRKLVKRFTRSKISTDEPERVEELPGNLYEPRYTQHREDTHTRREAYDTRMIHRIQRNGVNTYQNNVHEHRYRQQPRSRHEEVRPSRYVSERRVTGENDHAHNHQQKMYSYMNLDAAARNAPSQCHQKPGIRCADATPVRPQVSAPNHQQMYSYMNLDAAARNAPSQCHQKPGIRCADATPVRPQVRASNLQQRSQQIHPAPIGQSQSQWHHMGIRHRYGDVHAAERCQSRVDDTVQHQPLNRYRQPTPDTRHHRTIPNYSSPYGNTNTYRLPNRQESHPGYQHLPEISQRDGHQPNRPAIHVIDEHRTERSRLDRNLPAISQRDGHQPNGPDRHVRDEHLFYTYRPDRSLTSRHINERRHLDGHRPDGHCPNTTRIRYANVWNAESAPLTKEAATQTSISNSEASTQTNNVNKNESSTLSPSSAAKMIYAPLEKIQLEPPRKQAKLIISPALIKGVVLKKVTKII